MDSENITVLETQSFRSDVEDALKKLREKDVRIILGNFNEHWARRVFCEAYRLEMYGRSYQWLIMGTYSINWWMKNDTHDCTPAELQKALEATILTDLLPLSTTGDITIAGIVSEFVLNATENEFYLINIANFITASKMSLFAYRRPRNI